MTKDVRTNRDYSDRTITTARWARDQIKRQIGTFPAIWLPWVALFEQLGGDSFDKDSLPHNTTDISLSRLGGAQAQMA
jgi:hypothetical protein